MDQEQRLYTVFARGRRLRFLSHLDMMRLWERVLRRAQMPLRYSQGYHPHPRLSLALPLSVGMTAGAEWLEFELSSPIAVTEAQLRLTAQLPLGITLHQVLEASWKAPSLASRLRTSMYEIEVHEPLPADEIQERAEGLRQAKHWAVEEPHKGRVRSVDVRAMVDDVHVQTWAAGRQRLHLVLRHQPGRSTRVETVLKALGLGSSFLIHRQALSFDSEADGAVAQ